MNRSTLAILLVLTTVAAALAGTMWQFKCEDPKCKFEGNLGIGGGFVFGKATGYCTTCREFVSISWKAGGLTGEWKKHADKSNLPETPPTKLGTVWNPATGLTADLYPCPKCKRPFMEISDMDFMAVPEKVLDMVFLLTKRPEFKSEKDQVALLNLTTELMQSRNIFCPHCTNLTMKAQNRGRYD